MATGTHDACSESVDEMTTGPSDASSETVKQVTGSVVQLDREKCEGLIRPEDSVGRDLPFDRSVIALDERYLGEIIIGVQFCCDIVVDAAGTQKILKMTPAKMMVHEGIIKEIRRLEGVAEVSPNFLDTPVVFSRTHLDDPDSFQKLRIGDRVRVEMEFYNLISERKPPRASRVILLDDPNNQQCVRLRSALRRSNSLSGRPQNSDREDDIDQDFLPRPRSSSQGNRFVDDAWIDEYGPDFPVVPHDRRPRSLFEPPPPPPPTSFYPPHGFGAFPPISSPAAWMAQRSYIGMPFGPRSLPIGLPPNVHGVYRHQHFLQPGSMPGPYRCASSRFFQAPPFSYAPPNLLPESLSKHEPNARLNNTLPPLNPLTNAPPTSMDDSNVVLELTVDELRRLILEQPRVRSPDQHR